MSTQPPRGFAQAHSQAKSAARDKNKTKQLLHDALNKAYRNRNQLKSVWNDLMAVLRMLRAWSKGNYQSLPWKTIVLSLATVIYFLNPFDVAPDFIPGVGYLDDAVVLGFVVNSIKKELEKFLRWESEAGI
jgi:uncharacterized membrane protein YkvA (DUF1232 family)